MTSAPAPTSRATATAFERRSAFAKRDAGPESPAPSRIAAERRRIEETVEGVANADQTTRTSPIAPAAGSYTHLRAHATRH
ncbi:MAG: hypothetical protein KBB14_19650, partial [Thermoanaerobaculia bacterium]|nr:hypothetical protein [Thermoanaerobaculia bacterium]